MVNLAGGSWRRWRLVVAIALFISLSLTSCGSSSSELRPPSTLQSDHLLEFVPKQALLAGMVDTAAIQDRAWARSNLAKTSSQFIDSWLTPLELELNQDIRPWLGKAVAFAITNKDLDRDRRNGRQAGYLLVADTADGDQLREFLELFWQRQAIAGSKPVLTGGSGVPIIAGAVAQGKRQLATAVVGERTLLVANDVKVLRQSLQVAQAPNLQLPEPDCCVPAWLNVRIPELIDWLGLATPADVRLLSTPQWQKLGAAIEFLPQQLIFNTQLTTDRTLMSAAEPLVEVVAPSTVEPNPQQYLPIALAWAAMGHNLRPLWTGLLGELEHYGQLPLPLQQWQQWSSTQLAQTLSQPLSQLLSSDYALGQLADGNWLVAVVGSHPKAINQLDSIAKQQGLTVSQLSLKGQTATAWSRLKTKLDTRNRETTVETDIVALHTRNGDCDVFSTSISGLTAALEAPSHMLSGTQRFQRTMQTMDAPNQGYVYGTWDEIDRLLASTRWFALIKPIVQPWLQSIDAIAITSYPQTVNQATGTVSILLKD